MLLKRWLAPLKRWKLQTKKWLELLNIRELIKKLTMYLTSMLSIKIFLASNKDSLKRQLTRAPHRTANSKTFKVPEHSISSKLLRISHGNCLMTSFTDLWWRKWKKSQTSLTALSRRALQPSLEAVPHILHCASIPEMPQTTVTWQWNRSTRQLRYLSKTLMLQMNLIDTEETTSTASFSRIQIMIESKMRWWWWHNSILDSMRHSTYNEPPRWPTKRQQLLQWGILRKWWSKKTHERRLLPGTSKWIPSQLKSQAKNLARTEV